MLPKSSSGTTHLDSARRGRQVPSTVAGRYQGSGGNYQHEIGLRHHRAKKNRTGDAASTSVVPFRDLFLLVLPVTFTLKSFLAKKSHSADDVKDGDF
ncbi:MAG: hypothetical protein ABI745_10400 [Caldimonas sp.]